MQTFGKGLLRVLFCDQIHLEDVWIPCGWERLVHHTYRYSHTSQPFDGHFVVRGRKSPTCFSTAITNKPLRCPVRAIHTMLWKEARRTGFTLCILSAGSLETGTRERLVTQPTSSYDPSSSFSMFTLQEISPHGLKVHSGKEYSTFPVTILRWVI